MLVVQKVKDFIKAHKLEVFLVGLAAIYFLFAYITDPGRPGLATDGGWMSYFDQSAYLKQAIATAEFRLRDFYVYGPVYPLMAVPMLWLGFVGASVFVPFNLFAFVFIVWAVYRYMAAVVNERVGFATSLALMFATPLLSYMTVPWNSTVTVVSIGIVLWAASLKPSQLNRYVIGALALASALAFGARYIDLLWIFALSALLLYIRAGWRQILWLGGLTLVLCLPVLWTHQVIFGSPLKTPYVLHTPPGGVGPSDQDAGAYDVRRIPNAGYGMFVSPILAGVPDGSRGLLVHAFWFVFAFAIVGFIKKIPKPHRLFLLALLVMTVLHALFYLSFRASGPGAVKFGTLHYFKMFWPILAICASISLYQLSILLFRVNRTTRTPHQKSAR